MSDKETNETTEDKMQQQMQSMQKLMETQMQMMQLQMQQSNLMAAAQQTTSSSSASTTNASLATPASVVRNVKVPKGRCEMNSNEFLTFCKDSRDYKKLTQYSYDQIVLQM